MYLNHFGLIQYPFSLTPNTRYFLKLPSHQQAFSLLLEALDGTNSFAKITGEVGTGKTMLCRKVLNTLDSQPSRFATAYVPHPILSEEGIMQAIAEELGMPECASMNYYNVLKRITERLLRYSREGKSVVLLIDEAQAMPEETLEALYLLSTLKSEATKRLQIVLFGQPELDELLASPSLHRLNKSLSFEFLLPPLNRENTEAYVAHRLMKAGYNGPHMFSKQALNLLHQSSNGNPRIINILAHKAMMAAYGKGDHDITDVHVSRAVADTESAQLPVSFASRLFAT